MGIILVTLLVSELLALAIGAASWFIFVRKLQRANARVIIMSAIIGIATVGLLAPVGSFLWSQSVRQGVRVPLQMYHGLSPHLPATATDITYYSAYNRTEALFTIGEDDLAGWAKSNGWNVVEISQPERIQFTRLNINTSIVHGIVIEKTIHPRGTGVDAVFNRNTGECFFRFSSY